jgi:hypothetical protein
MADKLKKITVELQTVGYKKWNVSGLWQYQRSTEFTLFSAFAAFRLLAAEKW